MEYSESLLVPNTRDDPHLQFAKARHVQVWKCETRYLDEADAHGVLRWYLSTHDTLSWHALGDLGFTGNLVT